MAKRFQEICNHICTNFIANVFTTCLLEHKLLRKVHTGDKLKHEELEMYFSVGSNEISKKTSVKKLKAI